jgi:hypothetical protein
MKQKKKNSGTIGSTDQQILKCRDDKAPVYLSKINELDEDIDHSSWQMDVSVLGSRRMTD